MEDYCFLVILENEGVHTFDGTIEEVAKAEARIAEKFLEELQIPVSLLMLLFIQFVILSFHSQN